MRKTISVLIAALMLLTSCAMKRQEPEKPAGGTDPSDAETVETAGNTGTEGETTDETEEVTAPETASAAAAVPTSGYKVLFVGKNGVSEKADDLSEFNFSSYSDYSDKYDTFVREDAEKKKTLTFNGRELELTYDGCSYYYCDNKDLIIDRYSYDDYEYTEYVNGVEETLTKTSHVWFSEDGKAVDIRGTVLGSLGKIDFSDDEAIKTAVKNKFGDVINYDLYDEVKVERYDPIGRVVLQCCDKYCGCDYTRNSLTVSIKTEDGTVTGYFNLYDRKYGFNEKNDPFTYDEIRAIASFNIFTLLKDAGCRVGAAVNENGEVKLMEDLSLTAFLYEGKPAIRATAEKTYLDSEGNPASGFFKMYIIPDQE